MSIGAPVMRSYKNCALPRLMNPVLDSGYILENMISMRVFSSGLNFAIPMDVPFLRPHVQFKEFEEYLSLGEVCHHMESCLDFWVK